MTTGGQKFFLTWPGGHQDVSDVEQVTLRVEDADGDVRELTVERPVKVTMELVAQFDLSAAASTPEPLPAPRSLWSASPSRR